MRRIGEWSQKIKDRSQAQLSSRRLDVLHRGMHCRSIKKSDADLFEAGGYAVGRKIDANSQRLHHVRRTAFRTDAAITVLGDAHARSGRHECGCGRDVE